MKFQKIRIKVLFLLSAVMIVLGLINITYNQSFSIKYSSFFILGLFELGYVLYLTKKPETETISDERQIRVRNKSAYYVLNIMILYVIILTFFDLFFVGSSYSGHSIFFSSKEDAFRSLFRLMSISGITIISWLFLISYYDKKMGD